MGNKREPMKQHAIEKKDIMIRKGFELICEEGYHRVSCADIAKYAGVSTGCVYQYFDDKHDILLAGVRRYADQIWFPIQNIWINAHDIQNHFDAILDDTIEEAIQVHTLSSKAHSELMSMSYVDPDIATIFRTKELEITDRIVEVLKKEGFSFDHLCERVHLMMNMIDNLCHEMIYHNHSSIDYQVMKKETVKMMRELFYGTK